MGQGSSKAGTGEIRTTLDSTTQNLPSVPTAIEIEAVKERQPVIVRFYLLDGAHHTVPVESWTTVAELNKMSGQKCSVQDSSPFAMFEVSNQDEERVMEEDERVLDLLAFWQREFNDAKAKSKKAELETFRFLYKMRLFFDIPERESIFKSI